MVIFLKAIAVRLLGMLLTNRLNIFAMLRRRTLIDLLTFAVGATSIPGLFIVTRYLMQVLQKLTNRKFETLELLISGAVASLGTCLFDKSYQAAIKAVAYMRAV